MPIDVSRPSGLMVASRKLRPPLKTFGGKFYLARRIISLMPPHRVYVEPYLGGGSVLLNRVSSAVEIASDIDPRLVNFWRYLSCSSSPLIGMLQDVAYAADRFEAARAILSGGGGKSGVIGAMAFLIANRLSRGGLGKEFAWSDRLRGGQPGDVNAWDTIRRDLPLIAERIREVQFPCDDGMSVIRRYDAVDALIYCDPPYLHETRTAKSVYPHEMTRQQHEELLATILRCRSTVLISGYRSDLYDEALSSWTRHEFSMPNHSGQGRTKNRRIECLWINRPAGGT